MELYCTVCDTDFKLTEKDLKRAAMHKDELGNLILVSCPNCCRVHKLVDDKGTAYQWKTDVSDATCVPILDDDYIRLPAGVVTILGKKKFTSGAGDTGLSRYEYMNRFGIDPLCAVEKNPSLGKEPFVLGEK